MRENFPKKIVSNSKNIQFFQVGFLDDEFSLVQYLMTSSTVEASGANSPKNIALASFESLIRNLDSR